MATIDDPEIIAAVIDGDGFYPGDRDAACGPVVRVTRYVNGFGAVTHGIVYASEAAMGMLDRYQRPSAFISDPVITWELPPDRWPDRWRHELFPGLP